MSLNRREFLSRGSAGLSLVSLSSLAYPLAWHRAAVAAALQGNHEGRTLVVLQLAGGNDGLNTLIPAEDDAYYRARPELGIREGVHRLKDGFALHPAMEKMAELFKDGRLAVVHGVGYPNPNRSHFRSMEIWHTARPAKVARGEGWLGRYLDRTAEQDKLAGIAFTGEVPQSLLARRANIAAVEELENYGVVAEGFDQRVKRESIEDLPRLGKDPRAGSPAAFLRRSARNAYAGAKLLREAAGNYQPRSQYVGPLGRQLRMAVQVIAAQIGVRIIHVALDGFDTHANQAYQHAELLGQLSGNLASFLDDMRQLGRADEVLVMTYSEFGRRMQENGGRGTDHGAAAPMFLAGEPAQTGLHGTHPSLTDLEDGDPKFTTDFRSVYATVLEDWLGTPAQALLGGQFAKLPLIEKAAETSQAQPAAP